jgi:hypothetical protein
MPRVPLPKVGPPKTQRAEVLKRGMVLNKASKVTLNRTPKLHAAKGQSAPALRKRISQVTGSAPWWLSMLLSQPAPPPKLMLRTPKTPLTRQLRK